MNKVVRFLFKAPRNVPSTVISTAQPLIIRKYSADKPDKPEDKEAKTGPSLNIKGPGIGLTRFGLAQEEGYFYNKDKENLNKLKQTLKDKEDSPKPKKKP